MVQSCGLWVVGPCSLWIHQAPSGFCRPVWQEQEHGGGGLCYCQLCCCEESRDPLFIPYHTPAAPSGEPAKRVDSGEGKESGRVGVEGQVYDMHPALERLHFYPFKVAYLHYAHPSLGACPQHTSRPT